MNFLTNTTIKSRWIAVIVMLLLLSWSIYNRKQIFDFFETTPSSKRIIVPNKGLEGKYICSNLCSYVTFDFKGNSTVVVDSFFVTSYILDNQYVKIKADKSDLLLRIVDQNTLVGEGFAKGTYIKNGKLFTNIQKIDTKNKKKHEESNENIFIQQELTDQLKGIQDFIINNPERVSEVYFGEENILNKVKSYLLIKSIGALIIKKNNQYHRNEKIGDVYLYTEEGRKGSDEKMKVEYQFRKNNSTWIIQEFRFITTDVELD